MPRRHTYFVYIMANSSRTLYIGVTNNLEVRAWQHKTRAIPGFTSRYGLDRLIWFEETSDVNAAIAREKQMKNWHRTWKINLIKRTNPEWRDLAADCGLGDPETPESSSGSG